MPAHAIVGGQSVTDEVFQKSYPWQVLILTDGSGQACGGSLIASTWVLTAAHCIGGKQYVLHGKAERLLASREEIKRAFRHPDYDARTGHFDFGLIELNSPVAAAKAGILEPFDARIRLADDTVFELAGWGRTRGGVPAQRLQTTRFTAREVLLDSHLIALNASQGPCAQDSGTALVVRTADQQPIIVGIASRTDGNLCAAGGGYAIYARVDRAVEFFSRFGIEIN